MNVTDFQYILKLAEAGSFREAAENIHITQQGLSYAIAKIEKELGAKLFERTSHGVELTDAGKIALDYARRIHSLNEDMKEKLAASSAAGDRTIRIAVQQGMYDIYKIDFTSSFAHHDPKTDIKVEVYSDYEVDRSVLNSRCDIGFSSGILDPREFNIYPLDEVNFVAIMSSSHPLAQLDRIRISDLEGVKVCLANEKTKYYNYFTESAARSGFSLDISFVFPELEYIPYVVRENLGVVISPEYSCPEPDDPDITVHPLDIDDKYLFALVTQRGKKPSPVTKDFISYVTITVNSAKNKRSGS